MIIYISCEQGISIFLMDEMGAMNVSRNFCTKMPNKRPQERKRELGEGWTLSKLG